MKPVFTRPIYRGRLRRLYTHYFGYGCKMWPWYTNRLKKNIRNRLVTEDYTCRLPKPPKVKPRVRYKLTKKFFRRKEDGRFIISIVYA